MVQRMVHDLISQANQKQANQNCCWADRHYSAHEQCSVFMEFHEKLLTFVHVLFPVPRFILQFLKMAQSKLTQ